MSAAAEILRLDRDLRIMEIVDETESEEMERGDHAMIDIENLYLPLATSLRSELETLYPLLEECTIHRVPESVRQLDEKAYKPRVVSIGPIHHGRQELKAMENYKRRYLQDFIDRTEVSLEDFIKVIKKKEEMLRSCYAESIELNSDDFVKMILIDAVFIIEVLLRNIMDEAFINDRVYSNPYKIYDINEDMYMLENQLPFFILKDLFTLANIEISSNKGEKLSILKIAHEFSKRFWDFLGIEENFEESKYSSVKHLVDFLRICMVPSKLSNVNVKRPKILTTTPSITELRQAGVKLKLGSNTNLFEISFRNGILEIPQIKVHNPMEYVLKNLLAFEQCQCDQFLVNDYVIFMNYLVNTPKDVKILIRHEIIENLLGDSERVSTLFHKLVEQTTFNGCFFYFSSLVEELNMYCRKPWHKWKAILKQDYFKTPWTTISVIAASILLILTVLQTIIAILQVK